MVQTEAQGKLDKSIGTILMDMIILSLCVIGYVLVYQDDTRKGAIRLIHVANNSRSTKRCLLSSFSSSFDQTNLSHLWSFLQQLAG